MIFYLLMSVYSIMAHKLNNLQELIDCTAKFTLTVNFMKIRNVFPD